MPVSNSVLWGRNQGVVIYIPTRGRVGWETQVTLREFSSLSTHRPVIVCPPDEAAAHRAYWPRVLPCPAEGIGPTRQWLLEGCGADVMVMADDDMYFFYRPDVAAPKLERATNLNPLIAHITELCLVEGYLHGGVGARQGNNRLDMHTPRHGWISGNHLYQDCVRVNNFHFVRPAPVLAAGARFDRLPVMEDFHFTLTMLCAGHPNIVIHDHVWNQRGSGCHGGCSLYRTPQVQAAGARGLAAAFPRFVRLKTKTSKDSSPAWKDFKTRDDVVVLWQKAFESSGGKCHAG